MKKTITKAIINSFECGIVFTIGINFSLVKQENSLQILIGLIAIILAIFVQYKIYKITINEIE